MIRTFTILSIALFSFLSVDVQAQDVLPRWMTDDEARNMDAYLQSRAFAYDRAISTPPTGTLRTAAEWEEVQALVITWTGQFPQIHSQIVDASQQECLVIITCQDSTQVISDMAAEGVTCTNCRYIEQPFNSVWIRDYGANTVYMNDVDSLILVDWIYNRPRPDDDLVPEGYAALLDVPLYGTVQAPYDLMNTGGNFMADGFGTAFASLLVDDENDGAGDYSLNYPNHSPSQVDSIMKDFMGVTPYIKMPTLPYDGIHHIDMHMKLIDEETLLVSEYPQGVADGPQIEANLQYVLNNYTSVFGTPYELVRITVPPSTSGAYPDNNGYYRTYSNQTFVNNTILLPTYREEYDTIALRTLEEAMPGYNIVSIDVDDWSENLIQYSGAIHCITHTIGVEDPLLIRHQRLRDTYDDVNPYAVDALIKHRDGIANAQVYWTTDTTLGYPNTAPMTSSNGTDWTADIPAQAVGTEIFYYIDATATNGKNLQRPITAPAGYWSFEVLGAVGIQEDPNAGMSLLDVFPNPANAITCIPVEAAKATKGSIKMYDIVGNLVEVIYEGDIRMGESKYFIHANEYPAGSYMIVLETEQTRITKKLMIE